ncbi:MAG: GlmU family protein [Chitinophagales bacterium]|nr:GlmU family protein [Bacteroidota bacterium]MCB9044314.1 GlmU family protein [Chitinophagales bacterium]
MKKFDSLILFDDLQISKQLLPFTYTRPIASLRLGISTIAEKWQHYAEASVGFDPAFAYLTHKYSYELHNATLWVNASFLPDEDFVAELAELAEGESLWTHQTLVAYKSAEKINPERILQEKQLRATPKTITRLWDIFKLNDYALQQDYTLLTQGRNSQAMSDTNTLIGPSKNLFIEAGAKVEGSIFNVQNGPIFIGKNAEIMEGCLVRGGFALGEGATLKMGTKIYGATTVGPGAKVGGELNNVVIWGNSNKAHDGFLGNSVIGEWCNLGADTNNSNLKNNYDLVKVWDYVSDSYIDTGLQFCGLFMGDHSKCGINTMFNTGTVVGVCANIFGAGFPDKFVPSFTWGGVQQSDVYQFDKSLETAGRVLMRRQQILNQQDTEILQAIFAISQKYRKWYN